MKNLLLLPLVFTFFITCRINAQSCLPDGITFSTQSQIDSFQFYNQGCTEIEGGVIILGDDITNLNGLDVITLIGGDLKILGAEMLNSLEGFNALTSVESLVIQNNPSLMSLTGLNSLEYVDVFFIIENNPALVSLSELNALSDVGRKFDIRENTNLTSLHGLESIDSLSGILMIVGNPALTSLSGLDSLIYIDGWSFNPAGHLGLIIVDNDSLTSFQGLNKLSSITGETTFDGNSNLNSFSGLENLVSVAGEFNISNNPSLTSLNGLDGLTFVDGDLIIGGNSALSICHVPSICSYLENGGSASISGNAPGCNSQMEVEDACQMTPIEELSETFEIQIFPNPASGKIELFGVEYGTIQIIDNFGNIILKTEISESPIEISQLSSGIYFIQISSGNQWITKKLIKI